uniref:non-specific serine/threonine protein kinase n=1 Tax=Cucumis melo TaxID=3656 RepID=A0A9I9EE62_CUCME
MNPNQYLTQSRRLSFSSLMRSQSIGSSSSSSMRSQLIGSLSSSSMRLRSIESSSSLMRLKSIGSSPSMYYSRYVGLVSPSSIKLSVLHLQSFNVDFGSYWSSLKDLTIHEYTLLRGTIIVIAVILTPTHLALVMEYASGGKLFVFCIMHDCVPAIVHYDVTTKNALLDVDFEAHVVDFGAARFLKFDALHSADVAGTHGYMAPGDLSHQEETSTSQHNILTMVSCDTRGADVVVLVDVVILVRLFRLQRYDTDRKARDEWLDVPRRFQEVEDNNWCETLSLELSKSVVVFGGE